MDPFTFVVRKRKVEKPESDEEPDSSGSDLESWGKPKKATRGRKKKVVPAPAKKIPAAPASPDNSDEDEGQMSPSASPVRRGPPRQRGCAQTDVEVLPTAAVAAAASASGGAGGAGSRVSAALVLPILDSDSDDEPSRPTVPIAETAAQRRIREHIEESRKSRLELQRRLAAPAPEVVLPPSPPPANFEVTFKMP